MPNKNAPADQVREATAALFEELAAHNATLARLMRNDPTLEPGTIAKLFVEAERHLKTLVRFEARLTDR
jgi:hypothetical protein